MLLVSPERLNNPGFRDEVLPRLTATAGLLVVDEAHCISDWGHDFRPDYRRIRTLLGELPDGIPVLATTATANARVTADVAEQLGPTRRPGAARLASTASRCAWASSGCRRRAAAGLAGRPPRRAARVRHHLLPDRRRHPGGRRAPARPRPRRRGVLRPDRPHRAARPRAGPARRPGQGAGRHQRARHGLRRQPRLRDQPRCAAVAGRLLPAGRPRRPWHRRRDGRCCSRRPRTATSGATSPRSPSRREELVRQTLAALDDSPHAAVHARARDVRRARPARGSRRCSRCSTSTAPYAASRAAGSRPGRPWSYDADRYQRVSEARQREQDAMLAYLETDRCRMEFLREQLDDPGARALRPVRQLRRPRGRPSVVGPAASSRRASGWPGPGVVVEPRKMWPDRPGQPRHRPQGPHRRRRPSRAGPSPGSPTSATARRLREQYVVGASAGRIATSSASPVIC